MTPKKFKKFKKFKPLPKISKPFYRCTNSVQMSNSIDKSPTLISDVLIKALELQKKLNITNNCTYVNITIQQCLKIIGIKTIVTLGCKGHDKYKVPHVFLLHDNKVIDATYIKLSEKINILDAIYYNNVYDHIDELVIVSAKNLPTIDSIDPMEDIQDIEIKAKTTDEKLEWLVPFYTAIRDPARMIRQAPKNFGKK